METTGEEEAVTPSSRMDIGLNQVPLLSDGQPQVEQIYIKEENLLTDEQPETEQIYLKEENVKLELPEDHDGSDPLQENKVECVPEEGTTYLPDDVSYIKQEPECVLEEENPSSPGPSHIKMEPELEVSSCGSEAESTIPTGVEGSRNVELRTGTANTTQCPANKEASCVRNGGTQYVILTCTICEKTFADLQALKEHNHLDMLEFPYSCRVCCKSFSSELNLMLHSRQHGNVHDNRCHVCQKTFSNFYGLKAHLSVHTGERPYSCRWCGKTFRTSGSMKAHCRLHTGERPYNCVLCHNTFRYLNALKRHIVRLHRGEWS